MSASNQAACCRAQLAVMEKVTHTADDSYRSAIAERLWRVAGVAAAYLDWPTAITSARLASELGVASPAGSSTMFRLLARVNVALALHARELTIRVIRPSLRSHYPRLFSKQRNERRYVSA
jgi:hypothetical protein